MKLTLSGKVAVVTGGGGGLGSAVTKCLANVGANVIITHRGGAGEKRAEKVLSSLPDGNHMIVQASVENYKEQKELARVMEEKYGVIDILVNNAGITRFVAPDDLEGLDDDLIDSIFKTNWRGSFATIRGLEQQLRQSKDGLIINISSIAGTTGVGSNIAYCASKSAINTMTIALARTLAPRIRVLSIAPGLVEGEYTDKLDPAWTEEQRQMNPLKRLTTADDVAQAVLACATLLTYSTGCVVPVDGGRPLT
jgi:3-oxoacyl-[acyl-carrier protein] reductase